MRKQNHTQWQCTGLTSTGLTSAGLTSTGLTSTGLTSAGLTSTGLTSAGLTSTGLTSTPLLVPNTGRMAGGPKRRSEVWLLLARTSKTTHKGNGPKSRTNLPTQGLTGVWDQWSQTPVGSGPKPRSEVSLLLACTSKTTHKGAGPRLLNPKKTQKENQLRRFCPVS